MSGPVTPFDNASDLQFALDPARLNGVIWRRVIAYWIDLFVLGCLYALAWIVAGPLVVLSFGLLLVPLVFLIGLIQIAYHTLLIGGPRAATLGQRLLGIEVLRTDGGRPSYLQALIQTVIFYLTVSCTGGLILLVVLFNARRRAVHDFLAGTLTLRRLAGPDIMPPGSR